MKRFSLHVAGVVLFLQAGGQAMAGPVLDFTGGVPVTSFSNQTSGWEFTVTSAITVSALGLWNEDANGFTNAHQIGLWTAGGTLLTSALITTADSTPVASTTGASPPSARSL